MQVRLSFAFGTLHCISKSFTGCVRCTLYVVRCTLYIYIYLIHVYYCDAMMETSMTLRTFSNFFKCQQLGCSSRPLNVPLNLEPSAPACLPACLPVSYSRLTLHCIVLPATARNCLDLDLRAKYRY